MPQSEPLAFQGAIPTAVTLNGTDTKLTFGGEIHPYTFRIIYASIISILVISYVRSLYKSFTSQLGKIPGPWYAPITSLHLAWMFSEGDIWKYVRDEHKKRGPVIRLGPRQIWVSGKAAMKDVLLTTDLPKVSMYSEISRDRKSPGLFGEIRPGPHKNLKRFLGPAFTISAVDQLDNFFMDCCGTLVRNYYEGFDKAQAQGDKVVVTDLMRDLHCLALDIMGESAFGKGFGQIDDVFNPDRAKTKEDKAWIAIPDAIFDGQAKRYRMVYVKRLLRKVGIYLNFDWPKELTKAIANLIEGRRGTHAEAIVPQRRDILQHMIEEGNRPDTGVRMNNQDIVDQMSELMLAGSETTSGTIACLFLELARNKDVKEKLLKSLPVFGRDDPIVDSKEVRENPQYRYLEACIKENLRMHPIASEMGRRTLDKPFEVDGYYIPPYTVVSASYRDLHLNEDYWPEADRFWPERWLDEEESEGAPKPDMEAYFPFSAGKHSCIGQNFAYAEMRTVSANLFTRFDIDEYKYKEIDFRQFITMQFHDGKWATVLTPRAK